MRAVGVTLSMVGLVVAATGFHAGCGDDAPPPQVESCRTSNQAFVRNAIVNLLGRKPWGQQEVNAYAAALSALENQNVPQPRRELAYAIMAEPEFVTRWTQAWMDMLQVSRVSTLGVGTSTKIRDLECYGTPPKTFDGGKLAAWVRDNFPSAKNPPTPNFTMGLLMTSSIELDDVTPIYRAHLFALLALPITGANVELSELEIARRRAYGAEFNSVYLNRDRTCLPCHNSDFSVTDVGEFDRHWPVPGRFETALFGSPTGDPPANTSSPPELDSLRTVSMFRYLDVADGNGDPAWGWNGSLCGTFRTPTQLDPLGVDTYFGSIKSTAEDPTSGQLASVFQLDLSLKRGFEQLRTSGLAFENEMLDVDPDTAFAYLVAMNIVDQVWEEMTGSPLTISTHFPRNEAQRDTLQTLTTSFIKNGFSLKSLLADIVSHPLLNVPAPDNGCGEAYGLKAVFNPWAVAEEAEEEKQNGAGDLYHAPTARHLANMLHTTMEWPRFVGYPTSNDVAIQTSLGLFLKPSQPGFRGFDLIGRLTWEKEYGSCQRGSDDDFIDAVVKAAEATPDATIEESVIALKDRLVGEPSVDEAERDALTALAEAPLGDPVGDALEMQLRRICGAKLSTPQFLLVGLSPPDADAVPRVVVAGQSWDAACNRVRASFDTAQRPHKVSCGASELTVAPR